MTGIVPSKLYSEKRDGNIVLPTPHTSGIRSLNYVVTSASTLSTYSAASCKTLIAAGRSES